MSPGERTAVNACTASIADGLSASPLARGRPRSHRAVRLTGRADGRQRPRQRPRSSARHVCLSHSTKAGQAPRRPSRTACEPHRSSGWPSASSPRRARFARVSRARLRLGRRRAPGMSMSPRSAAPWPSRVLASVLAMGAWTAPIALARVRTPVERMGVSVLAMGACTASIASAHVRVAGQAKAGQRPRLRPWPPRPAGHVGAARRRRRVSGLTVSACTPSIASGHVLVAGRADGLTASPSARGGPRSHRAIEPRHSRRRTIRAVRRSSSGERHHAAQPSVH